MSSLLDAQLPGIKRGEQPGKPFENALRVHGSLTAGIEKRLLLFIARRLPDKINSDHLTLLGFASQVAAGGAYALASRDARALWLVSLFLVLNWLGDSLDGTVARIRDRQRPRYGFYVDHIVDMFGALALMGGLGISGYMHWPVAAGLLVCFYALSIESYLTTYTMGKFNLSHFRLGPTEIRILMILGNAAAYSRPYSHLAGRTFLLFDISGAIAIAAMMLMVVVMAIRHTSMLYREEALS